MNHDNKGDTMNQHAKGEAVNTTRKEKGCTCENHYDDGIHEYTCALNISQQKGTTRKQGHTEGPWRYQPPLGEGDHAVLSEKITNFGNFYVAVVHGGKQAEANARLIAAAPELLEALKDIANTPLEVEGYNSFNAVRGRFVSMKVRARAAIETIISSTECTP
jgi:hypothetical protein